MVTSYYAPKSKLITPNIGINAEIGNMQYQTPKALTTSSTQGTPNFSSVSSGGYSVPPPSMGDPDAYKSWLEGKQAFHLAKNANGGVPTTEGRPSALSIFESAREAIQVPNIGAPAKTASVMEQKFANVKPIQGLSQDFFAREREARKEGLRDEFFGELGIAQQTASGESAAGRLGSGVGTRVMQEAVAKPFAQGLNTIDRDIYQAQAQEAARVESVNHDMDRFRLSSLQASYLADSQNETVARQAQAQLSMQANQIAQNLALGEAGLLSTEQVQQTIAQFNALESAEKQKNTVRQISQIMTEMAIPPSNWAPNYFADRIAEGATLEELQLEREQFSDGNRALDQVYGDSLWNAWTQAGFEIPAGYGAEEWSDSVEGYNDK